MSYARRQQYRRLSRAAAAAVASAAAMMLALAVASAGTVSAAGVLLVLALGFGVYARHWMSLAVRSAVGARSEDEVRHALAPLKSEGWRLRHSLSWSGRGDVDSVAIAPGGVAFAVEVTTSRYEDRHLALVQEQAAWLRRFRRKWRRRGAVPVMCVAHSRDVRGWEDRRAHCLG